MLKLITKILLLSLLTLGSQLLLSGCADAGKNQKVNVGDTVNLDGSASQGRYGFTILGYKWKQIKGEDVEIKDANESIATFIAVDKGKKKRSKLVFELTTVEKAYWGQLIEFRDRVRVVVKKSTNGDVTPPIITLNGDTNIELFVDDTYVEEGATATDAVDGAVAVTTEGTVDTSKVGTYTITYSAKDNAGNVSTMTRTVIVKKPVLRSLMLESNNSTLNIGEQVSFEVMGTYSDGNTKKVDANITWIISPVDSLEANGTSFVAIKDGNVTVQIKVKDVLSNVLTLNIVWVVNGHVLPPEPDPKVNDSTLLGIDVNDNGIRDDVEIYIIKHYAKDPKYPKTKTAIALQYAWASQKILENPTIESVKYIDDAIDCQYYWFNEKQKDITNQMIKLADRDRDEFWKLKMIRSKWKKENKVFNDPKIKDKIYNTRERIEQKFRFNASLSGNIFNGRDENLTHCRTNINELGE
jgi:hypothetical protein